MADAASPRSPSRTPAADHLTAQVRHEDDRPAKTLNKVDSRSLKCPGTSRTSLGSSPLKLSQSFKPPHNQSECYNAKVEHSPATGPVTKTHWIYDLAPKIRAISIRQVSISSVDCGGDE